MQLCVVHRQLEERTASIFRVKTKQKLPPGLAQFSSPKVEALFLSKMHWSQNLNRTHPFPRFIFHTIYLYDHKKQCHQNNKYNSVSSIPDQLRINVLCDLVVWWMGTGASVEPAASIFMVEELN
jgi:hypothetical protein